MFNLDPSKLLIIAVVAIILLGPDRLPAVARQVGGAWRSFTAYRHKMESQVRDAMPDLPSTEEIGRLARSPAAFLNHLSKLPSDEATPERAETVQSALGQSTNGHTPESAADYMARSAAAYRPEEPVAAVPTYGADPGLN
jgi:Sec-independent protein translocase protein TatA